MGNIIKECHPSNYIYRRQIMKKKIIKTRDKIARELWTSNQFKQKVIPNKKKIIKKFDYKKEISYYPNAYLLSF